MKRIQPNGSHRHFLDSPVPLYNQALLNQPEPSTYLRLISMPANRTANAVYKTILFLLALSVYIAWLFHPQEWTSHRMLTIAGVVFSLLVRLLAHIELLIDTSDSNWYKNLVNRAQILSFVDSLLICSFYLILLARPDYGGAKDSTDQSINFILHLVSPLPAILPICLERTFFEGMLLFLVLLPLAISYIAFMWIYVKLTGDFDYSVFKYDNLTISIYSVVGLVLVVGYFYAGWGISKLTEKKFRETNTVEIIKIPKTPIFTKEPLVQSPSPDLNLYLLRRALSEGNQANIGKKYLVAKGRDEEAEKYKKDLDLESPGHREEHIEETHSNPEIQVTILPA